MTPHDCFLAACRSEEVPYTPVWFMRQAGRYLPGYKEVRKNHSVVEICKTPSTCEAVTLMPVKELGVDAAVMFADIMLPLEGMGVDYQIEENLGPVIAAPIRGLGDVEALREFDPKTDVPYVLEAIGRVRSKLSTMEGDRALLGFSGAPFTVASYLVEGRPSRDFAKTKRMMLDDPEAWNLLMSKLADMVSDYLAAQIEAGADAVQLFDSWVGALSAVDYERSVAPHTAKIFRRLASDHTDTPKIHFGTGALHLLRLMRERTGGDVFSVDWRTTIRGAREALGAGRVGIQGNLEPAVLLSRDVEGVVARRTQMVLDDNGGSPGHIFNLGHGVLRDTPVENARFVVDYVHEKTRR